MEDRVSIETPEHVQVSYELAGIGSRGLACIMDTLIQVAVVITIIIALMWLSMWLSLADFTGIIATIAVAAVTFMATVVYYVVCEMVMNGQSIGKRMAGLRVVRTDGTPITFLDSAVRNILRLIDVLPGLYTVGLVAAFFSSRMQRLGDMAAGTIVIKERLYDLPDQIEPEVEAAATAGLPPELAARLQSLASLIDETECAAAVRFLERRAELDPAVRLQLANRLAEPLVAHLPGMSLADFPSAEAFLAAVVRLRARRL